MEINTKMGDEGLTIQIIKHKKLYHMKEVKEIFIKHENMNYQKLDMIEGQLAWAIILCDFKGGCKMLKI